MSFDPVPLMIGGGEATHSADLVRLLIWSVFRGNEGFLQVGGGRVTPLNTPGRGFQVAPSPFVANSKAPGITAQAYLDRIIDTEIVTDKIVDTPPSRGQSDLVAVVIKDPYQDGGTIWPYPGPPGSDARKFGPYVGIEVIPDIPNTTYCLEQVRPLWTGLAVARLDRPMNSGIITQDMIKNVNTVCNPLSGISLPDEVLSQVVDAVSASPSIGGIASGKIPIPGRYTTSRSCVAGNNSLNYSQSSFKTFPNEGSFTDVLIPTWATYADVFCVISNPYQKANVASQDANVYGETRFTIKYPGYSWSSDVSKFDVDELSSGDTRPPPPGDFTKWDMGATAPNYRPGNRPPLITTERMYIPDVFRGKKVTLLTEARMYQDRGTQGRLIADNGTGVYIDIVFKEKP